MITDKMLEENTTPWGLLSLDMRNALQACNLNELEIYMGVSGWTEPIRYPSLMDHTATLRKKPAPPTKPDIPWDAIKDEFKWAARNKSGVVYVFTHIPEVSPSFSCWDMSYSFGPQRSRNLGSLVKFDPGTCDWQDSLVQRP